MVEVRKRGGSEKAWLADKGRGRDLIGWADKTAFKER